MSALVWLGALFALLLAAALLTKRATPEQRRNIQRAHREWK